MQTTETEILRNALVLDALRGLASAGRPNACEAAAAAREAAFLGASLVVAVAVSPDGIRDALEAAAREIHDTHAAPHVANALWGVVDALDRLAEELPELIDGDECARLLAPERQTV